MPDRALRSLVAFLHDLHSHRELATLPSRVAELLARLFDCDSCAYVTVSSGETFELSCWPAGRFAFDNPREVMAQHANHPLVARYAGSREPRAWRLSDPAPAGQLAALPLYRGLYRSLGIEYQLAMVLPGLDAPVHVVALHRSRADFSEEERELLELLAPHLVQAVRNLRHLARTQPPAELASEELADLGVMLVGGDQAVTMCTQQARLLLQDYFGESGIRGRVALPPAMADWLAATLRVQSTQRFMKARPDPLIVARETRALVVNLVSDPAREQHLLTLSDEKLQAPPRTLVELGLTQREAEVLCWVAQGKTNREIGMILDMSARTVQKHLEHVFQKLGVESRVNAMLMAWQAGRFGELKSA